MIMTVEELKGLTPQISVSDEYIAFWLEGIEKAIQAETNNGFERYRGEDGEIEYPADIKLGVLELYKYAQSGIAEKAKQGIASETISRHSVSYQAPTKAETIAGYPASLMGFIDPYRRARF